MAAFVKQACGIARILCAAPGRPSSIFTAASKSTEGARDARVLGALKFTQCAQTKMLRPADLDASQHRGG